MPYTSGDETIGIPAGEAACMPLSTATRSLFKREMYSIVPRGMLEAGAATSLRAYESCHRADCRRRLIYPLDRPRGVWQYTGIGGTCEWPLRPSFGKN